jgi:CubicO group peptidase (beta-lactamase class C family)
MAETELTRRAFTLGTGATLLTLGSPGTSAPSARASSRLQAIAQSAPGLGIRALVVVRNGETILSHGDVALPLRIASIRKSLLSALFGMADRNKVRLDASLSELGVDDYQSLTSAERSATVRHLLTARSGIYLPTAAESEGMKASRPARGSYSPGTFWYYNNWDFNALGEIYQRLTREDLMIAIEHRLARPLGWRDFDPLRHTEWVYDPAFPRFPSYNIHMSTRDMARFGQFFLSGGAWNGVQLLPTAWVEESTRVYSTTGRGGFNGGYGYMWWVATDQAGQDPGGVPVGSYSGAGNGGRYITVLPAVNLVVAVQPFESRGEPQARLYTEPGAYSRLLRDIVRALS